MIVCPNQWLSGVDVPEVMLQGRDRSVLRRAAGVCLSRRTSESASKLDDVRKEGAYVDGVSTFAVQLRRRTRTGGDGSHRCRGAYWLQVDRMSTCSAALGARWEQG